MVALSVVPLLYPAVPPLVDLFGHMGRYRVELDLESSPWLRQFYDFRWSAIGNLGVDLLIVPLSAVLGLELAVKLIVLAIPPMTVAGLLWVAREVHHRLPPTALFALPFACVLVPAIRIPPRVLLSRAGPIAGSRRAGVAPWTSWNGRGC